MTFRYSNGLCEHRFNFWYIFTTVNVQSYNLTIRNPLLLWCFVQVWFSNRRARWRKQVGAAQLPMPGAATIPGYNPLAPTYMGLPDTPGSASLGGLASGSLSTSSALSGLAGGFTGNPSSLLNSPPVSAASIPSSISYSQFSGKMSFPTSTADPYSNVSIAI